MLTLSLPPRPILLFGCASVTVPQAIPPRGTITTSWTFTSSRTSKSTLSFSGASADEIVRLIRNLTGVPSSNPNASGSLTTGATAGGVADWTFLSWAFWTAGNRTPGKTRDAERIIEQAAFMAGCLQKERLGEKDKSRGGELILWENTHKK